MRISIPEPPSVNHMYRRTWHGVALTDQARAFRRAVGQRALLGERPAFHGPLAITIVQHGKLAVLDIDNGLKAALDALAKAYGFNDRVVARLSVTRLRSASDPHWDVRIAEVADDD